MLSTLYEKQIDIRPVLLFSLYDTQRDTSSSIAPKNPALLIERRLMTRLTNVALVIYITTLQAQHIELMFF